MFVAPDIDRRKAEEILSRREGMVPRRRKIIKTELLWLPLYVFEVLLEDSKGARLKDLVSVDGIKGEFALYRETAFAGEPPRSGNQGEFIIGNSGAREAASREYLRMLHNNNMRKRNPVTVISFSEPVHVFYPYWIGYHTRRSGYDFEAIDAVSGGKQGVRMKPVFIDLILQITGKMA